MRILFISQLFDPENSVKGLAFAKGLQELGHQVEVVTTFPSYPEGKIYRGYRQTWRMVEDDSVRVVRVPSYIYHGKSAVRRLLSYGTFGLAAGMYAMLAGRKPDVIYGYYPPVVVGLVALMVAKLRGIPYVYDVQDLWPEALIATGSIRQGGIVARFIEMFCGAVYRCAARVVVLSDGYRAVLAAKGVPTEKVVRIFNWCDESRMKTEADSRGTGFDSNRFNILYAGNLGAAQALGHVIEAAKVLQDRGESRVRFILMGEGGEASALRGRVQELELKNIDFLPRVPVDDVGAYLSAADALLVHLADDPVFDITIPQKTQAYLMAGRPILMAVRGEAAKIVNQAGAGMAVEPCRPDKLAEAAIAMSKLSPEELRSMGDSGVAFYWERMSMSRGVQAVDELLRAAVAL